MIDPYHASTGMMSKCVMAGLEIAREPGDGGRMEIDDRGNNVSGFREGIEEAMR